MRERKINPKVPCSYTLYEETLNKLDMLLMKSAALGVFKNRSGIIDEAVCEKYEREVQQSNQQ